MDEMDYWRLCDEVSVLQAAVLIVEENPSEYRSLRVDSDLDSPEGFYPAFTALCNAIRGKRLKASIEHDAQEAEHYAQYGRDYPEFVPSIDWEKTTVYIEDVRAWLRSRGIKSGFFFPQATDAPDYLDSSHSNYAPKLAAAIDAWQAVNENPVLCKGTTVKQALQIWLRKNANEYGLTKDDGSPNEQGIGEIAKISNWATKGGAPKTPG